MTTQPTQFVKEAAASPAMAPPILPIVIEQTARNLFESFSEKLKESLNGRQDRALKLALEGHVSHKAGRIYSVRSEDGKHAYLVNLDARTCTCPDSHNGHVCKHRLAAYLIEQANQNNQAITPSNPSESIPANLEPEPPIKEEEVIDKARLIFQAKSQFLRESIIYAVLQVDGQPIQVEILDITGDVALVRALPKVKDGLLVPHFPFQERTSVSQVIAKCLADIRIYR
jgi:hypothetical protein